MRGSGMETEARQSAQSDQDGSSVNRSRRPSGKLFNLRSYSPQSSSPQSGRDSRSAILIIGFLIVAACGIIGGLLYDQAALTRPSDGMAGNPAVRDFARAIELIEDNYAGAPDKERLTREAVLG